MKRIPENLRGDASDELDALLAARPVRPSADFTSVTLARIACEREAADAGLDPLLASRPVSVSPGFVGRVLAAVDVERRRRFVLRVVTPFAAAACLTLAALPLVTAGSRHAASSPADRVAAALDSDPELRALVALPSSSGALADTRSRDLAAFADIDAALNSSSTEYAYGI